MLFGTKITQNILDGLLQILLELCSMGQGRTHHILLPKKPCFYNIFVVFPGSNSWIFMGKKTAHLGNWCLWVGETWWSLIEFNLGLGVFNKLWFQQFKSKTMTMRETDFQQNPLARGYDIISMRSNQANRTLIDKNILKTFLCPALLFPTKTLISHLFS